MKTTLLMSFFQVIVIFIFFPPCNLTGYSIHNDQLSSNQMSIHWPETILQLCFASAMEISLLWVQLEHSQFPLTLRLVSVANFLAFVSILLATFVVPRHPSGADILEKAAIFFFFTAFFLSVTVPFPLCIKCIAWSIYVVSSIGLFLDNCSPPPSLANWVAVGSERAMLDSLVKFGPPPS